MNENENIRVLKDTLQILRRGFYWRGFHRVMLKLSQQEQSEAVYFSENMVKNLRNKSHAVDNTKFSSCSIVVENLDSFEAARRLADQCSLPLKDTGILVLNFANPVIPGGGVRRGAKAQEEDLCRRSSLLMSLESKAAAEYYCRHEKYNSWLSSDSMILSPKVEVFRDKDGRLLKNPFVASVLTCAAPITRRNFGEVSDVELREILYNRIMGMLCVAIANHYSKLVLGAWGCGAFGNDPIVMADMFHKALVDFGCDDPPVRKFFEYIVFAVLDHTSSQKSFNAFLKAFSSDMKEKL